MPSASLMSLLDAGVRREALLHVTAGGTAEVIPLGTLEAPYREPIPATHEADAVSRRIAALEAILEGVLKEHRAQAAEDTAGEPVVDGSLASVGGSDVLSRRIAALEGALEETSRLRVRPGSCWLAWAVRRRQTKRTAPSCERQRRRGGAGLQPSGPKRRKLAPTPSSGAATPSSGAAPVRRRAAWRRASEWVKSSRWARPWHRLACQRGVDGLLTKRPAWRRVSRHGGARQEPSEARTAGRQVQERRRASRRSCSVPRRPCDSVMRRKRSRSPGR